MTQSPIRRADGTWLYACDEEEIFGREGLEEAVVDVKVHRYRGSGRHTTKHWMVYARRMAQEVRRRRVGNCEQLALVACLLLWHRRLRPVDFVFLDDNQSRNKVLPHAVAVLGRAAGRLDDETILPEPASWPVSSVICDPWNRIAYPACQARELWTSLTGPRGFKNFMDWVEYPDQFKAVLRHRFE
jgi:hypothetical protein